jgi:hypothetical protein
MVVDPNNESKDYPMAYTYINGKLTEAVILNRNDHFVDGDSPS